jgi:nucleotide-binding universal stress UspA family protein
MDHVVVGFDGSPSAGDALRWACAYAGRHGCPIVAVLVDDASGDPAASLAELDAAIGGTIGEGVSVHREVLVGEPADALLEAANDASLVVVGAATGAPLGPVSRRLVRSAPCAVALVRGGPVAPDAPVVVGVDGSASSRAALRWALTDAAVWGRTVHVVRARLPRSPQAVCGIGFVAGPDFALDDAARADLDDVVDSVVGWSDAPVLRRIAVGAPSDVLVADADRAATVVLGARGAGGFDGLQLGTVGGHVAAHSRGTVVVVPLLAVPAAR